VKGHEAKPCWEVMGFCTTPVSFSFIILHVHELFSAKMQEMFSHSGFEKMAVDYSNVNKLKRICVQV